MSLERLPIPGDPAGLLSLAAQLQSAASDVASVQERVAANGLQASWVGTAAENFRGSLNRFPGELTKVATAFGDAAGSLSAFARTLAELQTNASQYETQISNLQVDLRAAQVRQDAASTKVAEARLAHAVATDPLSLHTAATALDLGLSFEREAVAEVEEIGAEIARFFQLAATNRTTYDNAVRACCAALGVAYDAGSGSFGAWAERHTRSMAGLLLSPFVGVRLLTSSPRWVRSVLGGAWTDATSSEAEIVTYAHDTVDTLNSVIDNSPVGTLQPL